MSVMTSTTVPAPSPVDGTCAQERRDGTVVSCGHLVAKAPDAEGRA